LGASAIGFLAVVIVVLTIRRRSFRAYQEKLSQLGLLYGELGERIGDLGTDRYTDRFLELSERKEQLEASKGDTTGEADRLMEDMQSFLSELEAADTV